MTSDDISRLARIVREETGNQVQEKNFSMLESRMSSHIMRLGLEHMAEYWPFFSANEKAEREAIQSLMTTHYTFFFREYAHFEVLENWIETSIADLKSRFAKSKTPVRVWAAAASRGQEIYSLAMFLETRLFKKHGLPYEILGTDIDAESIAYAVNGVYPMREVNTIPKLYLDGFWKKGTGPVKNFAAVHPTLKSRTRFQTLNLLETQSLSRSEVFDVIFCRNVFIYFSADNVQKISRDLVERLNPNGLFVSGMSEPLRFEGWTLATVGPSCYQKPPMRAPEVAATLAKPTLVATAPQRYRVLCVDDSTTIQTLLKKIFAQDPLCEKVDVAGNGREAKKALSEATYDLITLDIHMPDIGGIEFLETLYDRAMHPPVLMVSSVNRTDLDLATKSIALGAFDYVEKPAMNALQKSVDEILAKAKMAMRSRNQSKPAESTNQFDLSIGQKIVVPDASQCLRVVFATNETSRQLEQIIRAQSGEYRSPALLIIWRDTRGSSPIESDILRWTERPVVTVRDPKQSLRANHVYIELHENAPARLDHARFKSVSVQVLDPQVLASNLFKAAASLQILLDETLASDEPLITKQIGFRISDITPATSFASLSVEFFANLRKAAA